MRALPACMTVITTILILATSAACREQGQAGVRASDADAGAPRERAAARIGQAAESLSVGEGQEVQATPVDRSSALIRWNFDTVPVGQPPAGFTFGRTGRGRPGRWIVRAAQDAPSAPNVLVQIDTDTTSNRFPVADADEPSVRDLTLSVRCKPISGRVDRACGLVFRYQDEDNYYIARANPLENNVRFYYVKDGQRRQLAGWSGPVRAGTWHELRAEARGDRFLIYWDGRHVIDERDATFANAGRVGVWTKADSSTEFDDLSVTPLGS